MQVLFLPMEEKFPVVIDVEKICEEEELKKLREACERWGSFRIINHSIPPALVADMEKVVEALHDLPLEAKKRNTEAIAGGGYVGPTPLSPLYEAIGIYDISSSQSMHNFCSQLHVSPQQRFPLFLNLSLSWNLFLLSFSFLESFSTFKVEVNNGFTFKICILCKFRVLCEVLLKISCSS
ncbi:hypothetical protein V8G54_015720 [Vigna mungo]|uniref:Non-haem dioxygenase N-terminal domain-containing protein n=1 Tax=Vigna mungo TaxID=3915 RepID=A0AAQ3NIZ6_VIGMU